MSRGDRRRGIGPDAGGGLAAPVGHVGGHRVDEAIGVEIADQDDRGGRRRKRLRMERQQTLAGQRRDIRGVASHRAAERMPAGVERRAQRIDGDDAGVVGRFVDGRQQLGPAGGHFRVRKLRPAGHVARHRQHRGQVVDEARRGNDDLLAAGAHRQRRAPAVELVGDSVGAVSGRAFVEDPGGQRRGAGGAGPIGGGAGVHADGQRHGGDEAVGGGNHRQPVGQHPPDGSQRHQRASPFALAMGSKMPMVRLSAVRYFVAAAFTSSSVTASSRVLTSPQSCQRPIVAK